MNKKTMNRRQVYSILLKLLSLLGVVVVMAVMINSLFPVDATDKNEKSFTSQTTIPPTTAFPVDTLIPGKLSITHWGGKQIGLLKRMKTPVPFTPGQPLSAQWRSVHPDYFVFYNTIGAAQCPLFVMPAGNRLKDTCTGIFYDTAGQRINGSGAALAIPPHYFKDEQTLIIGRWHDTQDDSGSETGK